MFQITIVKFDIQRHQHFISIGSTTVRATPWMLKHHSISSIEPFAASTAYLMQNLRIPLVDSGAMWQSPFELFNSLWHSATAATPYRIQIGVVWPEAATRTSNSNPNYKEDSHQSKPKAPAFECGNSIFCYRFFFCQMLFSLEPHVNSGKGFDGAQMYI